MPRRASSGGQPTLGARGEPAHKRYGDVDFVDLNMGCPMDLVCGKGGGAALMKRKRKVEDIVRNGLAKLGCPMTLKMRTGWDEGTKLAHTMV